MNVSSNISSDVMLNVSSNVTAYEHISTLSHHLSDAILFPFSLFGFSFDITKRVVMMWIVSLFLLLIFIPLSRRLARSPLKKPTRWFGFLEVLITFVRKDIGVASFGSNSKPYDPFLLTLFFFILLSNLLGLLPSPVELGYIASTAFGFIERVPHHEYAMNYPLLMRLWPSITVTGDFSVTLILSVFVFFAIIFSGFAFQGFSFIKNIVPKGIPAPLWLIMWPIEFVGLFIKPIALSLRLLANMTAGHMIILVLIGFIFQFATYAVVPVSLAGSTAIYMLEIFVAFLQAYIFTFLSSIFIAQVQHRH